MYFVGWSQNYKFNLTPSFWTEQKILLGLMGNTCYLFLSWVFEETAGCWDVPLVRRLIAYPALYWRFHISNYYPLQCVRVERNYRRGLKMNWGLVSFYVKSMGGRCSSLITFTAVTFCHDMETALPSFLWKMHTFSVSGQSRGSSASHDFD